ERHVFAGRDVIVERTGDRLWDRFGGEVREGIDRIEGDPGLPIVARAVITWHPAIARRMRFVPLEELVGRRQVQRSEIIALIVRALEDHPTPPVHLAQVEYVSDIHVELRLAEVSL